MLTPISISFYPYGKNESESSIKSKPKSRSVSEQEDTMKVARYHALLQESKEFVDGICREYCNQNVERVKHIKKIVYVKIPYYYCVDQRTNAYKEKLKDVEKA